VTLIEHPPAAEDHMGAAASAAGSAAGTPDNTPAGVEPVAPGGDHEKFSIFWFTVQVVAQIAGLVALFRFGLPGVWEQQLAAGPGAFIACFLAMHMVMCFFEWGFHRYVLHGLVSPVLVRFVRAHRNHHGLTPIKLQPVAQGSDRFVLNRYPIMGADQYEDSAFPWYATMGFWAFFTPLLVGVQLLLPTMPVMLAGYAAITFSMMLYEILHAIEHLPYEWWKGAVEHPVFGRMWTSIYGFHHFHHANVGANEAISGFFGLPVADWCFGTYHQPKELLLEGRVATAKDFAVKPPPGWVRSLDDWARKRESEIMRQRKS
jgi:hemolysin III